MISKNIEIFCDEYWKIENYILAVNDLTQTWHCHHRLEEYLWVSKEYLKKIKRYYHVPADELIFLPPKAHRRLHDKLNKNVAWLERDLSRYE